jgi:hypothetical protein
VLQLASINATPHDIVGGDTSTVTLTLTQPAPAGGAKVTISSSSPLASLDVTSVTIPAGQLYATVNLSTVGVNIPTSVTLTAKYIHTHTTHVTLLPLQITGMSKILPTKVVGGSTATATLTFNGPAPVDTVINVTPSSSSGGVAWVTGPVILPAGSSSLTLTVNTGTVTANTLATITASLNGTSASGTLTVKP